MVNNCAEYKRVIFANTIAALRNDPSVLTAQRFVLTVCPEGSTEDGRDGLKVYFKKVQFFLDIRPNATPEAAPMYTGWVRMLVVHDKAPSSTGIMPELLNVLGTNTPSACELPSWIHHPRFTIAADKTWTISYPATGGNNGTPNRLIKRFDVTLPATQTTFAGPLSTDWLTGVSYVYFFSGATVASATGPTLQYQIRALFKDTC